MKEPSETAAPMVMALLGMTVRIGIYSLETAGHGSIPGAADR